MAASSPDIKLFGKYAFDDVEVRACCSRMPESLRALIALPQVTDISLEDYIAVKTKSAVSPGPLSREARRRTPDGARRFRQVYVPHTAGRYQKKRFRKAQCPIVERLEAQSAPM